MESEQEALTLDLQLSPVDSAFLLKPKITLPRELSLKVVRQSYIFFVLELRTGVTADSLVSIRGHILSSCEEIIDQGLRGISFIVNGEHHIVKDLNMPSIKELLTSVMNISQNDNYHQTLVKTRHSVQTMAQRLEHTRISLVFFFSYVEIDHSLGLKKRSYIDYLNEHSDNCLTEVERLRKTIEKFTDECKTYIISYDKAGQQLQDYSMADTQLMNQINMLVGNYGSMINRTTSFSQLGSAFQSVTALLYNELYSICCILPIKLYQFEEQKKKDERVTMLCSNSRDFQPVCNYFYERPHLDIDKITQYGVTIENYSSSSFIDKIGVIALKAKVTYVELDPSALIVAKTQYYCEQLGRISWRLASDIVKYKRVYQGGKSFLQMNANEELMLELRDRIDMIYEISKELYGQIFEGNFKNKHELFDSYSQLKAKVDAVNEVLLSVIKKQLGGNEIGRLSQAVVLGELNRALKVKLIRRINANPYLLDQIYQRIAEIVDGGTIDYLSLEVNSQKLRSELGNCIISDFNFVKALKEYDAMGIAFEIQRPESAIADPGRIRIRQVSPSLMRVSCFFEKFLYKINFTPRMMDIVLGRCAICKKYCPYIKYCTCIPREIIEVNVIQYDQAEQKVESFLRNKNVSSNSYQMEQSIFNKLTWQTVEEDYLRVKAELYKSNYQQRCDYTDRSGKTPTVLGFMPLYLSDQHWKVAKQLMKPCLAWTATGEPLGYAFAQYQTIPFMVLSSLVRTCKELEYAIETQRNQVKNCKNEQQLCDLETRVNKSKKRLAKLNALREAVEQTCKVILLQLSSNNYDNKLLETLAQLFAQYKQPINRTVDVISNNSCFIGQLLTAFRNQLLPKPTPQAFDWFFKRLIEEELRRETDGWNEEETQDCFIDRLLNVETKEIKTWEVSVIGGEEYYDKFMEACAGNKVEASYIDLKKEQLQMMLRKQGKFNESQRMLLIQYKRLYENRVLWMWYVRFLLYGELQRVAIHKWKCLGLNNSYMLFTLIIQNKKQRKNYRRREAINNGEYADPFDYPQARHFLEDEFINLRNKKESEVVKYQNVKVCTRAAAIFCESGCLEEVAGTLLDMDAQCSSKMQLFYRELKDGKTVRLEQKMRMLLLGEYRGVRLFKGWKISKKKMNYLRSVYPYQFMRYQYLF